MPVSEAAGGMMVTTPRIREDSVESDKQRPVAFVSRGLGSVAPKYVELASEDRVLSLDPRS
jgi:hypothetical protein